jgi:hypothetical protein
MTKMVMGATLVTVALLLAASFAGAGEPSSVFDLSLRWREDHVTLGGRLDGPLGPTSGTVSGRLGRGGIVVDGWFDDRGRTWTFELDASLLDGLRAVIRRAPQRI